MTHLLDEIWHVFQDTPVAFALGVLVGFGLASKYRVIRRRRKDTDGEGATSTDLDSR